MVDPIPEDVESLLRTMSEMVTTMPTLADVVTAFAAAEVFVPEDEVMGRMESAIALGYVDIFEDLGPETMVAISTLGAEKMGIRPTFDSRRWVDIATRKLLGPPDRLYRERAKAGKAVEGDEESATIVSLTGRDYRVRGHHENRSEDRRPLDQRPDAKQLRPDEIVEASEWAGPREFKVDYSLRDPFGDRAKEQQRKPYSGDEPEDAPSIIRFYGLNAIWNGEEDVIPGACPYCKGEKIGVHGYCLKCHAAGMDRFLEKPKASRRKQMPKGKSKLKGGV